MKGKYFSVSTIREINRKVIWSERNNASTGAKFDGTFRVSVLYNGKRFKKALDQAEVKSAYKKALVGHEQTL